jgi:hypothetical protein
MSGTGFSPLTRRVSATHSPLAHAAVEDAKTICSRLRIFNGGFFSSVMNNNSRG